MFAAAVVLLGSGCTSITTSDGAERQALPKTTSDGYQAIYAHRDTRVSGVGKVSVLFWIFAWGSEGFAENSELSSWSFLPSPSNFAKSSAVYNACRNNTADTLLGTRYTVTTVDYWVFKKVTCEVNGYPAVMTGVEELTPFVLRNGDQIVYLKKSAQPTSVK